MIFTMKELYLEAEKRPVGISRNFKYKILFNSVARHRNQRI